MIQMYTEETLERFINNPSGLFEKLELEFVLEEDSRLPDAFPYDQELLQPADHLLMSPSNKVISRILGYSQSV